MNRPVVVVAVVAAFTAGSLAGLGVASAATVNDADCRKVASGLQPTSGVNSAEVLEYDACRFDKLDAAVKALGAPTPTPSATATPSATPTPSTSPSPSPTPTVAPTPTQTPTIEPAPTAPATPSAPASDPSSSDFPGTDNTGVPAGVTLRTVKVGDSGPGWSAETVGGNPVFYVRTAGTVIDSLNIPMTVKVMANNVTIKRSKVVADGYYTVNVSDPPRYYTGLVLTDVELDGKGTTSTPGIAVMASGGATYTRLDVHGFGSSGPRLASGATLQDSWIHGFVCNPPDHSAGSSANDGGSNIKVLRNNIDVNANPNECASTAIGIDPDFGNYDGVQVLGNKLAGGAYCVYTAQNQGAKNVRVEGNTFVKTAARPKCGIYGPAAQVQSGNGNTFTGNVYSDGSPVTA